MTRIPPSTSFRILMRVSDFLSTSLTTEAKRFMTCVCSGMSRATAMRPNTPETPSPAMSRYSPRPRRTGADQRLFTDMQNCCSFSVSEDMWFAMAPAERSCRASLDMRMACLLKIRGYVS